MVMYIDYRVSFILLWIHTVKSMSLIKQHSYFMDNSAPENDVADIIVSKGYLPNEKDLPKTSIVNNVDNDVTYLLSKLSDEELIKLLNEQPQKNVYDLNDIVKVAVGDETKTIPNNKLTSTDYLGTSKSHGLGIFTHHAQNDNKRFRTVGSQKEKPQEQAFFRLNNKPVDPFNHKSKEPESGYVALQKLNNLLFSRPQEELKSEDDDDDAKKELLFDVLVAQLKTLCCKRKHPVKTHDLKKFQYKALLKQLLPQQDSNNFKTYVPEKTAPSERYEKAPNEYMFLIINDEIKSNASEELISVDPESLEKNSSVLLLGPISTPLTDTQLKAVMNRISNELAKPDYLTLLQQLSDGSLSDSNIRLMKSLVTGPETRRYIKPHRCNHQAPLSKVYGGPKWIICTGYLNLNTPSLYD